ncbi:MAG: hypothetical protein H6649_07220 [Caldilineae bacterium]|nr:hypothetical protein [Anaerolineae bacterium]MCB9153830.1 hypothetical protein [Caldilineae bacterium]
MNSLNEQQLDVHVRIVGWLRILGAAVLAVVGAGILILLFGLGLFASAESGESVAFWVLAITGAFTAGLMVVMAVPGFIAGVGLLKRKNWARILAIIVAVFDLLNFPVGTAVSLYSFYVLFQSSADRYFNGSATAASQPAPTGALVST